MPAFPSASASIELWPKDCRWIAGLATCMTSSVSTRLDNICSCGWQLSRRSSSRSLTDSSGSGQRAASNSCSWKLTWKTWEPPRVKFFCWLACPDRCWPAERLARRGLQHHPRCLLCYQVPETMHHATTSSSHPPSLGRSGMRCWPACAWHVRLPLKMIATLDVWWRKAWQGTPKPLCKGLDSITLQTPWLIWKHHDSCIFDRDQPSVRDLVTAIFDEAAL